MMNLLQSYWLEQLQASGLPVFRQAGGVATCGVAHRVGDGVEPLLLDVPLQVGVAGLVQAVKKHPLVPLRRAAWEES